MKGKALIVVDYQNDFVEGGSLEVKGALSLLPKINELIDMFDVVVYTKDWHPRNHKAFASNYDDKEVFDVIELDDEEQRLWPDHCIQDTKGADFVEGLTMHPNMYIFKKGLDPEVDDYSGFYDANQKNSTGLTEFLENRNIESVFICGLALDYCVKATAEDAKEEGFQVSVVNDAVEQVEPFFNISRWGIEAEIGVLNVEDMKLVI